MSPVKLEELWHSVEDRFVLSLGKVLRPGFEIFLILIPATMVFLMLPDWNYPYPPWARAELVTARLSLGLALVAFACLSLFIPMVAFKFYLLVSGAGAWLLTTQYHGIDWIGAMPFLSLVLFGHLVVWANSRFNSYQRPLFKWLAISFYISGFLAFAYWVGWSSEKTGNPAIVRSYWFMHPEYLLLMSLYYLSSHIPHDFALGTLSPANFLSPMPWTLSSLKIVSTKEERRRLWLRGWYNILVAQVVLFILFKLIQIMHSAGAPPNWLMPLWTYSPFLLMVVAGFNFTQGVARLFGLSIPDITSFLVLAKTPAETWIRANRLLYDLIFQKFYISIFRRANSANMALVGSLVMAFTIMLLFHEVGVRSFYAFFFTKLKSVEVSPSFVFIFALAWSLSWWFLFWLSGKIRNWIYQSAGKQWLGVLVTHILNAYVFALCYRVVAPQILKLFQ